MPTSDNSQFSIQPDSSTTDSLSIANRPCQEPESAYIRELVNEGVRFVQYGDLICKKELGSVSHS